MGWVIDVVETVGDKIIDVVETIGDTIFGKSNHDSGPRRTYEKQTRWDNKKKKLEKKIKTFEEEMNSYLRDSYRFENVQKRKKSLEEKIQEAEGRLASARQKQWEMEASMNELLKADIIKIQSIWKKVGNNAIDQIKENCPRLDELTSDIADIHNKVVEEQTQEGFAHLKKYRDEQITEKIAKIQDYQQTELIRDKLHSIIEKLEKLQKKAR